MIEIPVLALALQIGAAPPQPADTAGFIRRAARRAEAAFERIARQRAPLTFASYGGRCDEIVGRFCLTYDSRHLPEPAPEVHEVVLARRAAIEALRQAFTYAPESLDVTGPLVRYLVEDERPAEAVSAARAFLTLSRDTTWGALLLGFALHAADEAEATEWLELGVSRLPVRERTHVENVAWLLAHDEHGHYRRIDGEEREAYHEAFWRQAQPLFLLPTNDRRNEHLARHVWSRILSRAPVVQGSVRWGSDLEQLTVRYGTPRSRQRARGSRPGDESMIERYDPANLPYTPERLTRAGIPPAPEPGGAWSLEYPRARSGYASVSLRRLEPLDHQLSRFPDGDAVLVRVDAVAILDSVARAAVDSVTRTASPGVGAPELRAGLFLLDSLHRPVHDESRSYTVDRDTVRTVFTARAAPGSYVYSAEAYEPVSRLGARARYSVQLEAGPGPRLSDIVVAKPYGADALPDSRDAAVLRPLASLAVADTDTLGIYAEVSGLAAGRDGRARYRVELTRVRERGSIPAEVFAWIGRRLGIGGDATQPRVSWTADGVAGAVNAIAIDMYFPGAAGGIHVLELAVTDLVSGERRETRRPVLVR